VNYTPQTQATLRALVVQATPRETTVGNNWVTKIQLDSTSQVSQGSGFAHEGFRYIDDNAPLPSQQRPIQQRPIASTSQLALSTPSSSMVAAMAAESQSRKRQRAPSNPTSTTQPPIQTTTTTTHKRGRGRTPLTDAQKAERKCLRDME
jgi:hypothetical protein